MPINSKWAAAEPTEEIPSPKKQVRSSKKPPTPAHNDSKKKNHSKKQAIAESAIGHSDTDDNGTDSDWSRPSSGKKSAVFDNQKSKHNHTSKSLSDNPLAKALGLSLDSSPLPPSSKDSQKKGHNRTNSHSKKRDATLPKDSKLVKTPTSTKEVNGKAKNQEKKAKNPEKKANNLKKKIEEQRKLLEETKHKAQQKELINSLLEGDVSFDWEDDETELMEKLQK